MTLLEFLNAISPVLFGLAAALFVATVTIRPMQPVRARNETREVRRQ
jgi:hypothetical protein